MYSNTLAPDEEYASIHRFCLSTLCRRYGLTPEVVCTSITPTGLANWGDGEMSALEQQYPFERLRFRAGLNNRGNGCYWLDVDQLYECKELLARPTALPVSKPFPICIILINPYHDVLSSIWPC